MHKEVDTTKPSRELDAAVARAMGLDMDGVLYWPYYSDPGSADLTAVLDMILWLQTKGHVLIERINDKACVMCSISLKEAASDLVAGEPLQALALALCQVVVRVGGLLDAEEVLK